MKKTFYMLRIKAVGCLAKISINDVEILNKPVNGSMTVEEPLNNYILESGPQEIEVSCLPFMRDAHLLKEAHIEYSVNIYEERSGLELIEELESYQTPAVSEGSMITQHKSTFVAEVPYKLDAWQSGVNLKKVDFDVKEKLLTAYQKYHFYLKTGHYAKAVEGMNKLVERVIITMYLPRETVRDNNEEFINDMAMGYEVEDIPKDVILDYQAYGKLATLKQPNGKSALFLTHPDQKMYINMLFYIPEGKTEFEVI